MATQLESHVDHLEEAEKTLRSFKAAILNAAQTATDSGDREILRTLHTECEPIERRLRGVVDSAQDDLEDEQDEEDEGEEE